MKYARILNNFVQEVLVPHSTSTDIKDYFTEEIANQFVQVDDSVEAGMIKNQDGTFSAPPTVSPP